MRVHAARRHGAPGGVDLARARAQALAQLHDAAGADGDVAVHLVGGGENVRIAHDEVEVGSAHGQGVVAAGCGGWRGGAERLSACGG